MDKGRLLLAEDEMHAAFQRMNGGWLIAFTWTGGFLLLLAAWVFYKGAEAVDFDMLIALVPGVLVIVSGLVGVYLNTKIRTISLHENGIDNLRVSYITVRFTGFDEVGSADVFAESGDIGSTKDMAWILFWVKGRRLKPSNLLQLKDEDARKGKLEEIVKFLESRGVKVNLTGQAGEWIHDEQRSYR